MNIDIIFGPKMRPGDLAGWVTKSPMLGIGNSIYDFKMEITWLKKEGDSIKKGEIILGVQLDIIIGSGEDTRSISIPCELKAPLTGKITKLNYKEGDKIKLGDVIVNIDTDPKVNEEEDLDEDYIKFEDNSKNKVIDIRLDFAEEFTIKEWKKQLGDFVNEGEVFVNVDTPEGNFDVTSDDTGILVEILYNPGESFKKNEVIAKIYNTEKIPENADADYDEEETDEEITDDETEIEMAEEIIQKKLEEFNFTDFDYAYSVLLYIESLMNLGEDKGEDKGEDEDEDREERFYKAKQRLEENLVGGDLNKELFLEFIDRSIKLESALKEINISFKRSGNKVAEKWFYNIILDYCRDEERLAAIKNICDIIKLCEEEDYDVERPKMYNKIIDYLEFLLDRYNLYDLDFLPDLARRGEDENGE
jgi:phosphotransferase system IIA component